MTTLKLAALNVVVAIEIVVASGLTSLEIINRLDLFDEPQIEYVKLNPSRCEETWEIDEREPITQPGCNLQVAK